MLDQLLSSWLSVLSSGGKPQILMLGPDLHGLGGVSRVVCLWQKSGLFKENAITYLSTVDDSGSNKLLILLKCLFKYCLAIPFNRVVYCHTASFNSFYRKSLFIFLAVIFRKKVVLHIHPSYFHQFIISFSGVKKKLFLHLLRQVDTFVVLTIDMQKKISSLFPGKPVYVLRNPVDVDAMHCSAKVERDKTRFLFLGWYTQGKGVYDLVDAAEILVKDGVGFTIDFYGTKEIEKLESYVSEKKLDTFVEVHGWADEQQKLVALHRSTALVLPSHTEGIPNVILEAMAAKIPIVSTLVGGLTEVLRDGENSIIVEPINPHDLADKLKFVMDSKMYCNDLAENAYLEAKEKYDIPVIKRQILNILDRV